MNILSLFDGMGCARIAIERAGIKVKNYFASEIDKYAIKVSTTNYPDIIHIGDVTKVNWFGLPKIDLLIGGSPCQGFSFAGKQLNFNDPRSALFFEFVRILKEVNPTYFLLENVVMKKEYQDVISHYLGVEPIMINSALVSAQSRKRLYWTNISDVTQPEDRGIVLTDIIEDGFTDVNKSLCIDANYSKGGNLEQYFRKSRRQLVFNNKIYGAAMHGRKIINGKQSDNSDIKPSQRIELRYDEKSNCLTTVQKDTLLTDGIYWRKLTPLECERLQTVPDNYTAHVSNNQRYKMLGNGFTIDVIAHILSFIKD